MANIAVVLLVFHAAGIRAQFLGEEDLSPLQKTAVIGGAERDLDQIGSTIYTNRTTTHLNCASGYMEVNIDFNEPFYGILYPNGSRNSACTQHGKGGTKYSIELPLKGCGTLRVERRVFVNNIIIRFHKGLELEGDEIKTIICRYPSPEVIAPPGPPIPIVAAGPPPAIAKRVSEVEILMIICAIVFLALLLVGMACSYTCLKRRNIRIVRRRPLSLGPPSEISKLSDSTLLFGGLKIPRAHATSTSDSDTAVVSQTETLPSDYPSESPSSGSEVEELDVHSIEERLSSAYSDALVQSEAEVISVQQITRPPRPTFMVRVKQAPPPPRTPEPDYPVHQAQSQSLTTILERDESLRAESIPDSEHAQMTSEPEDYNPPPMISPPIEYAQVHRKTQEVYVPPPPPPSDYESIARSVSEHELELEVQERVPHKSIQTIETVSHLRKEITDLEETVESGVSKYMVRAPPSEPDSDYPSEARSVTDVVEDERHPVITRHTVDDRIKSTLTETHTSEDVALHRRYVKQYHTRPKALPPPRWNVAIRHYPAPKYADEMESSGPEWEAYSEPESEVFRAQMLQGIDDSLSQIEVEALEHPPPPNWTVLLRVLDPPPTDRAITEVLNEQDREKWRQIITTESTLRTMLTTATVREDFERIRRDQRYEKLFEPRKWDVIIRILSAPEVPDRPGDVSSEAVSDSESLSSREGWTRSRRTEMYEKSKTTITLPPLYEYDSDGNPVVRRSGPPTSRSRRSSKSSLVSGAEVRSLPETEVNFAKADSWSEASGPSSLGGARSTADRSHSEFTYRVPVIGDDQFIDTDTEEQLSTRTARSLARSASEFTEDWHHQDVHDRYSHLSESSVDSKPHRQLERSTSEYVEEPPHLSDFGLSDRSLDSSPTMPRRRVSLPYHREESVDDDVVFAHHSEYSHGVQEAYREAGVRTSSQTVYMKKVSK